MKCGDCKGELTGGYDLKHIICWSCHNKRGLAPPLEPPPTTEGCGKQPPAPPPMRNPHTPIPGQRVISLVLGVAGCVGAGFMMGFLARGGV